MKIINNKYFIIIISIIIFILMYVFVLPYIANGSFVVKESVIPHGKEFEVEPHNKKQIVFYSGFENDLILIYRNNLLYDSFLLTTPRYKTTMGEFDFTLDYNKETNNNYKIIVNLIPFNSLKIKLKKEYNFILIRKVKGELNIVYTNNLLWFEM